jgi:hypothetical protein
MLEAARLIDGTGVRIALNIPCISMRDVLTDRILTSVISAKQKKTIRTAQHKNPALDHLAPPISVPDE